MREGVIAIFDIGKTNKKILLFDRNLHVIHQEEQKFEEITDDDCFACDDIVKIENWLKSSFDNLLKNSKYVIKGLNFATYGASLIYLDSQGKRITPVYNYLKSMPADVLENFYEKFGGVQEFSRNTASPALGMLNSGLQILWLKKKKPEIFNKVKSVLHLPQYVSYLFTNKIVSDYTSIGCHTAMWDFDKMCYHSWLINEGIDLPKPLPAETTFGLQVNNQIIPVGIGIHDSSSSLVPYFNISNEPFILASTGTWCIFMNPFNTEPLTTEQLEKDTLCYMSVKQQQVKSSRLFLGHVHDVYAVSLAKHFKVNEDSYKKVKTDEPLLKKLITKNTEKVFTMDEKKKIDLSVFTSYAEAYHQLMIDLTKLSVEAINLIIPKNDTSKKVYISGGFARNEIYLRLIAKWLPGKTVYTCEIDNSTALGAAMIVHNKIYGESFSGLTPEIKEFKPFNF